MKKNLFTIAILLISYVGFSQDLKFKKNLVLIDGKESLKVDETDPNNISILDLDGNEIIFLKFIHGRFGSLYNRITFLDQNLTFTSESYIFTKKLLLQKLLADKTLANGKLDPEMVKRFIFKYDEHIKSYK